MEYAARLRLFGPIQVERDGAAPSRPGSRKALALLGYLAVQERPCSRASLADLFWGDLPEARGRANLSWALNKISATLPHVLKADVHSIQFRREACWLDLAAFEQLAAQSDPASLAEAVELYRSELMAGLQIQGCPDFEQWLLVEREHWHQWATHGLQQLADYHERQGTYQDGLLYTARLLALEPWQERTHRQRMRLLARNGQPAAAIAQYEACRRILADEFAAEPAEETTSLCEQIRAGWPTVAEPTKGSERTPTPAAAPGRSSDLPPQFTPFIGRAAEQAQVVNLLGRPEVRLLTIVGLGGVGKTSLAIQCAAALREHFRDGVAYVSLAPVMSSAFLVSVIAEATAHIVQGQGDPQAQLLAYLKDKQALLVLDNFEHLLDGADVLTMIVRHAVGIKLLVTSQERLNLHEEWVFDLHGLDVPESVEDPAFEYSSAIQLFVQHARRVRADYALDSRNAPFVVQICRLTAGLPLGIVLAAAWVRSLSSEEIATEIAGNLGFLTSGLRNLPQRHRSLHAVFDTMWGRLVDLERDVFARLAVFHGGFHRLAAEHVAGASPVVLAALVDRSLLRRSAGGRYLIHEMLRRYVAQKLARSDEAYLSTQDQHARYYAAFLQAREGDLRGGGQRLAAEAIGEEIDNIRAGWRWAAERKQSATVEQALDGLFLFYETRGWYREGDEAFGLAAAMLAEVGSAAESLLGKVLARKGACALWLARYDTAVGLLERGLALARKHSGGREIAFCLCQLSFARREQGLYSQAEQLAQEGLAAARASDDRWGMAIAFQYLGLIARSRQQYAEARQYAQQCLSLCSGFGSQRGIAFALAVLAFVALDLGEYAEAQQLLQQCLAACQATGFGLGLAAAMHYLGCAAYFQGTYTEAREQFEAALKQAQEIGYERGIIRSLYKLGDVAHALSEDHVALAHYRAALQTARAIEATPLAVDAVLGLAAMARDAGHYERAMTLLAAAMAHLSSTSDRETFERAAQLRADLATHYGPQQIDARLDQAQAETLEEVVSQLLHANAR